MNKRQKQVQKQFLDNETQTLDELKKVYNQALESINKNIEDLMARADADTATVVYQLEYQKALKTQINGILDDMNSKQFTTVADYLNQSYEDGFIGTMYDLHGQGVPLLLPIDQEQVVQAVQLDSKISDGLYTAMGENVSKLKKDISSQVSRGIATGMSYQQVAQQISMRMVGTKYKTGGALARSMTIARTEGHRIQCQAGMDALHKAKDKGADVVKQWDSTLDGRTRESHRAVDREIKELNEKFSNGLMFPGDPSGPAAEVCNCRCALLQRARSALKTPFSKWDSQSRELIDFSGEEEYNSFKEKYFNKIKFEKGSIFSKDSEYHPEDITRAITQKTANFVTTNKKDPNSLFGIAIESVKPIKGVYDVKAHGDYDGVMIFDTPVGAQELAKILVLREDYHDQPIRLLSCNTGKMVNGTCFAKELAEYLGVEVYAPNDIIQTDGKGLLIIGSERFRDTGEIIKYKP